MNPAGHAVALTLGDIAERLGLECRGDAARIITGVCALSPGQPDCLAFAGHARLADALSSTAAEAVIVPAALAEATPHALIASNPQLAFAQAAALFAPDDRPDEGIAASAVVHPDAQLGASVRLGPGCVIGARAQIGAGASLGAGCVVGRDACIGEAADIGPRVTIGDRVEIGARALILPGAVIGSRGFGNAHDGQRWHAIPQMGTVRIGDDVEIGANTTIDRGALGDTVIEDNVRIDNLCQIAHNVHIGAHTALASGVGIAGSTVVGRNCMLGGQVGLNGHIRIADGVIINGGSKVLQDVDQPGQYASGTPLMPAMAWRRFMAVMNRLETRLKALERGRRA